MRGASPRSSRSAVSEGRSRVRGASRGRRLVGAAGCGGPAGVTLQLALGQSGARLWEQRGGSSTSLAAARELRGSSGGWESGESGRGKVATQPVERAPISPNAKYNAVRYSTHPTLTEPVVVPTSRDA